MKNRKEKNMFFSLKLDNNNQQSQLYVASVGHLLNEMKKLFFKWKICTWKQN